MVNLQPTGAVFAFGPIYVTFGLLSMVAYSDIRKAIQRHVVGDWGDASDESKASNDAALRDGGRLFSVYHDPRGVQFWIITEADGLERRHL